MSLFRRSKASGPAKPKGPDLSEELQQTRAELSQYRDSLDQSQAEGERLREEIDNHDKNKRLIQREKEGLKKRLANLEAQSQSDIMVLESRARLLLLDKEDLRSKLDKMEAQSQNDKQLLEAGRNGVVGSSHMSCSHSRELAAIKAFLDGDALANFNHLYRHVDLFNQTVTSTSCFLVHDIIYHYLDLDRSQSSCKELVGGTISDLLLAESEKAEVSAAIGLVAPNQTFVNIVLQIFMVNFCISELVPFSTYTNPLTAQTGERATNNGHDFYDAHTSPESSTFYLFKASFLKSLSTIFEAASWTIRGTDQHNAFERMLEPLYNATVNLRKALLKMSESERPLELSLIHETVFDKEFMEVTHYEVAPLSATASPQIIQIIGTFSVGLKEMLEGGEKGRMYWKNILPAQVALESTLCTYASQNSEGFQPTSGQDGKGATG